MSGGGVSMAQLFNRYEICHRLLPIARREFCRLDGVKGVGIGPRERGGRLDPEYLCLIVYVDKKICAPALSRDQCVPTAFFSVATDVVQLGGRTLDQHNALDRRWLD